VSFAYSGKKKLDGFAPLVFLLVFLEQKIRDGPAFFFTKNTSWAASINPHPPSPHLPEPNG
jgi:hypothetical protein